MTLTPDEASALQMLRAEIFFDCDKSGTILVAKGIELKRLKLSSSIGKIVRAKPTGGSIAVKIDITNHQTRLDLTLGADGDELHIRVPIGVRFVQIAPTSVEGYESSFFYQANDGYNVLPHHQPIPNLLDSTQKVPELVLVTSPVPPRSGPIRDIDVEPVPTLTADELKAIMKPDKK